jgi:hypothetical protein
MSSTIARKAKTLELTAPEKLTAIHDLSEFDCGEKSINGYLTQQALKAQAAKQAVVYVVLRKGTTKVMGFYTLSSGAVCRSAVVPKSRQRNSPNQHPVTILGRMGISIEAQGQGYSVDLLQDAIERAISASRVIGSTAIIVHPLNERLAEFYTKYAGFIPCPAISPITMMLPLV